MDYRNNNNFSQNLIRLDISFFSGEKTEKATPKKQKDARNKGQVAKSQEIETAFLFLTLFSVFGIFAPGILTKLMDLFYLNFSMVQNIDEFFASNQIVSRHVYTMFAQSILIAAPLLLISLIVGLVANLIQVGWHPTGYPLKPQLSNLNPMKGLKRLFSMKILVDLIKSLLKFSIIFTVIYNTLLGEMYIIPSLFHMELMDSVLVLARISVDMGIKVGMYFIFVAAADYAYTKYKHGKDMRMSKQDIKDEHKNSDGDPQIKGKIRQRMREASMRRMMSDVPSADVIITNPTHFAVAIKYDRTKGEAPLVVAKGADLIAKRIRDIATENNVQLIENKPLARALYASVDIGQQIPPELYQAVAEILAHVYKLKNMI